MKYFFIKALYKTLLTALPAITYNTFTNNFFVPFQIQPYSTYINFKLNTTQVNYIKEYIYNYTDKLELHPIKILPNDKPSYFLSINIYNCTSPLFLNKNVTRCEINTYVKDNQNNYGTIILDYCSNFLSLDPVDLFKNSKYTKFKKNNNIFLYKIKNSNINFNIKMKFLENSKNKKISKDLIKFTDNIFYKNSICDKLYYDNSLINADIKIPIYYNNFIFNYKKMNFEKIHSIFYFKNNINFICGLWHNLYNKIYNFE